MYQSKMLVDLLQVIEDISFAPVSSCTVPVGPDYHEAISWAKQLVHMLANLDKLDVAADNRKLGSWMTISSAAYMLCLVIGDKITALHSQGLFTDEQLDDLEDATEAADRAQHAANVAVTTILLGAKIV